MSADGLADVHRIHTELTRGAFVEPLQPLGHFPSEAIRYSSRNAITIDIVVSVNGQDPDGSGIERLIVLRMTST